MQWIHRAGVQAEFALIPNATLRDERLSWAARGVLAEILSRPDDWRTCAAAMATRASKVGEGRYGMAHIYRELVAAGYVRYVISRGPGGRFRTDVHYYDTPQNGVSAGHTGSRSTASRSPGSRSTASPPPGSPPPGTPAPGDPPPAKPPTESRAGQQPSRTPITKTEHEDLPGENQVDVRPWDDEDLIKLTTELLAEQAGGMEITGSWARQVLRQIFEGRPIRRRVPYLRRALREDPRRYLPPAPPRPPPAPRPGVPAEDKPAEAEAHLAEIRKRRPA